MILLFRGKPKGLLEISRGNAAACFLKVPPVIPLDWVVIGLAICPVVEIVFGTYPAWKVRISTRLNPCATNKFSMPHPERAEVVGED
jgi:hypothetical protein